jgi:hypothetical protein
MISRVVQPSHREGYERSMAAGRWFRKDSEIRLEGRGRVSRDVL